MFLSEPGTRFELLHEPKSGIAATGALRKKIRLIEWRSPSSVKSSKTGNQSTITLVRHLWWTIFSLSNIRRGPSVQTAEYRRADKIADVLEEMVFMGQFRDGERLDETQLAAKFGVSRTPVREALQRLVAARLAEQRPRRGVFVKQPPSMTVVEMFETMAEIEGVCARLATERCTKQDIAHLKSVNELCSEAIREEDADAYSRHNETFHHLIYKLCGNAFLEGEALKLYKRLKPFRRVQFHMKERMAQSLADHHAIIAAVSNGEPETAASVLRKHIGTQGERFYQHMAVLRRTAANRNSA